MTYFICATTKARVTYYIFPANSYRLRIVHLPRASKPGTTRGNTLKVMSNPLNTAEHWLIMFYGAKSIYQKLIMNQQAESIYWCANLNVVSDVLIFLSARGF